MTRDVPINRPINSRLIGNRPISELIGRLVVFFKNTILEAEIIKYLLNWKLNITKASQKLFALLFQLTFVITITNNNIIYQHSHHLVQCTWSIDAQAGEYLQKRKNRA